MALVPSATCWWRPLHWGCSLQQPPGFVALAPGSWHVANIRRKILGNNLLGKATGRRGCRAQEPEIEDPLERSTSVNYVLTTTWGATCVAYAAGVQGRNYLSNLGKVQCQLLPSSELTTLSTVCICLHQLAWLSRRIMTAFWPSWKPLPFPSFDRGGWPVCKPDCSGLTTFRITPFRIAPSRFKHCLPTRTISRLHRDCAMTTPSEFATVVVKWRISFLNTTALLLLPSKSPPTLARLLLGNSLVTHGPLPSSRSIINKTL